MRFNAPSVHSLACAALCAWLLSLVGASAAGSPPVLGRVYPIEEEDALAEIERAVAKVDWSKYLDEKVIADKVRAYRPQNIARLPRAKEDRDRLVDAAYTLEFDIPDGKGGVLYPKGYTFNPLDYMALPTVLVIVDAEDTLQLEWLRKIPWLGEPRATVLLSGGDFREVSEKIDRPVFYLTQPIAERLRLEAVPCVVSQEGTRMRVREFRVEDTHAKK